MFSAKQHLEHEFNRKNAANINRMLRQTQKKDYNTFAFKLALECQKEIRIMDLLYKMARDGQKTARKYTSSSVNNCTNCNDVVFPSKPNNRQHIANRRSDVWSYLCQGMTRQDIAVALKVDASTISRDIEYLTLKSQQYIDDMAKKTLPFMYQSRSKA